MKHLAQACGATGSSLVLVHHCNKQAYEDKKAPPQNQVHLEIKLKCQKSCLVNCESSWLMIKMKSDKISHTVFLLMINKCLFFNCTLTLSE